MGYEKVTLKTFKDRLKAGRYKDASGAKKALGKAQEITPEDKIKARKMADKHFSTQVTAEA